MCRQAKMKNAKHDVDKILEEFKAEEEKKFIMET
jgi:hypothetical protein